MVQTRSSAETAKTAQRKREILAGASAVFRRQGLHATGMRDIASELDMHAGNLYYYFNDKQELLAFCQQEALSRLLELAQQVVASEAPSEEKLRQLIVGHVVCLNEVTPGSLAHLEVEALEQPWRNELQSQRDSYEELIRTIIRDGTEAGEFRSVDPEIAGRALLGALNWTVKWFRSQGELSATAIGSQFTEIFLNGLGKARAESGA